MTQLDSFLSRAEALLQRIETLLPQAGAAPDWDAGCAFRWRKSNGRGHLQPVRHIAPIALDDLQHVGVQKEQIAQNTRQFVAGRPANNVLLTGARGTGKSSLVKAALAEFAPRGLRLIEVDKRDLVDLPDVVAIVGDRKERFVSFCDALSFDASGAGYKSLKVALDGSIAG